MTKSKDAASPLRIVFAGTPEFAASSLAALLSSKHQVIAVYTQPDRPAGRGRKLHASPVKQLALAHDIPVHQPVSLKNQTEQNALAAFAPDLMVVAAYGLILPPRVLAIPRLGCINVHASLLPRWRGAAPIQHAILAGDDESGITIMQMDAGLDTGDMLSRSVCNIQPDDTGSRLHDRLARMGPEALCHALDNLLLLQENAETQDETQATYAHKTEKADAEIDWQQNAQDIERKVRAFNAWPVAYSQLGKERVRIWEAEAKDSSHDAEPGTILPGSPSAICVACGTGCLELRQLQLPGGKATVVEAIMNAKRHLFEPGKVFGGGGPLIEPPPG